MERKERKAIMKIAEAELAKNKAVLSEYQKSLLMGLHILIFYVIGVVATLIKIYGWIF